MNGREVPVALEEAYLLRDASGTLEEWEFHQEQVYRLRAEKYRYHDVKTKRSTRRREQRRARRAEPEGAPPLVEEDLRVN